MKAALTIGVVFALSAAVVVWVTGGKEVHAAVVSGIFTVFAAMGAAYVAFWQLREQRKNAEHSNRQNEALKLKKEIYEEAWKRIDLARAGLRALYTHLSYVQTEALSFLEHEAHMPGARLDREDFEALSAEANQSCLELNRLAETWTVADRRLRLFSIAFLKLHELSTDIERDYRKDTAEPTGVGDFVGASMDPNPPGTSEYEPLSDLMDMIDRWLDVIDMWESFIDDYQRAMQHVLLSDLFPLDLEQSEFKRSARRRIRRLTLADYDELIEGFEDDAIRDQLWKIYQKRRAANLGLKDQEPEPDPKLSTP
jgi:hypothetical protein